MRNSDFQKIYEAANGDTFSTLRDIEMGLRHRDWDEVEEALGRPLTDKEIERAERSLDMKGDAAARSLAALIYRS